MGSSTTRKCAHSDGAIQFVPRSDRGCRKCSRTNRHRQPPYPTQVCHTAARTRFVGRGHALPFGACDEVTYHDHTDRRPERLAGAVHVVGQSRCRLAEDVSLHGKQRAERCQDSGYDDSPPWSRHATAEREAGSARHQLQRREQEVGGNRAGGDTRTRRSDHTPASLPRRRPATPQAIARRR